MSKHYEIIVADALEALREMPDSSVHCCVTSPPYWGLRDYGIDGQIGLEETPEAHIERLSVLFSEVHRVLRNDGTLWVNYGDAYQRNQSKTWAKPKNLLGLAWRIAFALQEAGWYLRCDVIWHKPNSMPESVKDRPARAHEYLFLLSKSERYYYDHEAVREPSVSVSKQSAQALSFSRMVNEPERPGQSYNQHRPCRIEKKHRVRPGIDTRGGGQGGGEISYFPDTRTRRSVWSVPICSFPEAHFATYPPELIRPCILAGCPADGVVLDPFFGSGTTGVVAIEEGRRCIGVELNPEYAKIAQRRIDVALRAKSEREWQWSLLHKESV